MKIFILLPTQLFKNINNLKNNYDAIYLLEDEYYINSKFHKQKLLLLIASMNYYYDYLKTKINTKIKYFKFNEINYNSLFQSNNIYYGYDPIDKMMIKIFKRYNIKMIDSPLFLNTNQDLIDFKNSKSIKIKENKINYSQNEFYKYQRLRFNILLEKDSKTPLYGKWSFDTENRFKFDKNYKEIKIKKYNNKYLDFAKLYIYKNFNKSFGEINEYYYPCTHKDAITHLKYFIKYKLNLFGKYQDAISKNIIYGNHSNISAILNIGLITPMEVVDLILKYFNAYKNKKEIINSVEGLIRQIIGWREYIHFIYYFYGNQIQNNININLNNKLDLSWYNGNTNIEIVDSMILKLHKYAYLHHIERLMIINNLMYLLEIKFIDIYNWFMTCFIDSYDWVMIPNILMNINSLNSNIRYMGRIYLASDNYIKKMSDFNNRHDFKIINNIYWNFLKKYKNKLKKDYILASQISRIK